MELVLERAVTLVPTELTRKRQQRALELLLKLSLCSPGVVFQNYLTLSTSLFLK